MTASAGGEKQGGGKAGITGRAVCLEEVRDVRGGQVMESIKSKEENFIQYK